MKVFSNKISAGMTLMEMVVVIGIMGLLSIAVSSSITELYKVNSYTIEQSYEIENARRGLNNWVNDAREISYADDGSFPVVIIEPYRMAFYSDIDRDNSVEYVEYIISTTTLYRKTFNATGTPPTYNLTTPSRVEILSEYVQNVVQATPLYYYYDTNGTQLSGSSTLLTDVRYLESRLVVNIDPQRSPGEFLLRSGVAPRNLKDNL